MFRLTRGAAFLTFSMVSAARYESGVERFQAGTHLTSERLLGSVFGPRNDGPEVVSLTLGNNFNPRHAGGATSESAGASKGTMANWWWLTPEGSAAMLDPSREYTQEKGVAEAVGASQPALKRDILNECVRSGVKCDGGKDDSLSENVSFHLWRMRARGLVAMKKAGGVDDRRKRREAAPAELDVEAAVLMAAVEPIAKDRLLTILAGRSEAGAALSRLVADGRVVVFKTGKMMAAKDKE